MHGFRHVAQKVLTSESGVWPTNLVALNAVGSSTGSSNTVVTSYSV